MKLLPSKALHVDIARAADDVYRFVADPLNFPRWAAVSGPMEQIGPLDWKAQTAFGERLVRFTTQNDFGCFDHAVFASGEEPIFIRGWIIPNGAGCTLVLVFPQRPDVTTEQFASALQWIEMDLMTLRSLLEVDPWHPRFAVPKVTASLIAPGSPRQIL